MASDNKRFLVVLIGGVVLLVLVSLLSLANGPVKIPARDLLQILWMKAHDPAKHLEQSILFSVRLPRVLGAVVVGWSLASSGLCYQSLLKNPLASEYTLGIASGAAIGAVLSQLLPFHFPFYSPVFAFLGSLMTMLVVFLVARSNLLFDTYSLVLTGIILSAFANAVLSLILSVISPNQLHTFFFWFMGSFAMIEWPSLISITPLVLVLSGLLFLFSWEMNAISLSEEFAQQVGIPVVRTKVILYITAGLLTALTVSIAGTIGFIGLVVPHLGRLMVGSDNRRLIFVVPLLGSLFCILADFMARTLLAPAELPVGVVTAFVGVPVFLYFMMAGKAARSPIA